MLLVQPSRPRRSSVTVDQLSAHSLAEALVHAAQGRGLTLTFPEQVVEGPGQGAEGLVDGSRVAVGSAAWLRLRGYDVPEAAMIDLDAENGAGAAKVLVGVDERLVAAVVLADHLRPDARGLVEGLREAGIRHVALATGDRAAVADEIGRQVGVDRVYAEQSPEEKLELVRSLQADGVLRPVVMVGYGVNDAPALALADVGIAMGAAGATVAS